MGGESAKIEDDDASVGIVFVLIGSGAAERKPFKRQLEARLSLFTTFAFLLLALPDLLDDEGRQHVVPRDLDFLRVALGARADRGLMIATLATRVSRSSFATGSSPGLAMLAP
ncbi:MAG: hypothetical protein R3B70_28340 [Polyangiaceae bacterium]